MWNDVNLGINVNLKAMKLFGIEAATYFALITQILPRVAAKNTADENGFFSIDRKYVEEQIGLSCEKQYNCDSILSRNNLVASADDSRDRIAVDVKQFLSLVAESDPDKLAETMKRSNLPKSVLERDASNARAVARAEARAKKAEQAELERIQKEEKKAKEAEAKEAKQAGIRLTMKSIACAQRLAATDELKAALENWVDSIYDSKNFLTKAAIEIFCNKISDYSSDQTVQKELIEIATARSYKDATFVLEIYKRVHTITPTKVQAPQKITSINSIDSSVSF